MSKTITFDLIFSQPVVVLFSRIFSRLKKTFFTEHNTFEVSEGRSANLTRLSPSTSYTVWVRARSKHSAVSADSAPLRLRTYPPPPVLALKNVTPYEIHVLWPPPTTYQLHQ